MSKVKITVISWNDDTKTFEENGKPISVDAARKYWNEMFVTWEMGAHNVMLEKMDTSKRFSCSGRNFPTIKQALAYEAHGSWWVWLVPRGWLATLAAKYLAWKIETRFRRIERSKEFERKSRITNPEWWDNSDT